LADETPIIQTLFAVPMTCDGCAKDVSGALYKLDGISKVEANYKDQLVRIEGTGMRLTGCHIVTLFCPRFPRV
jgi:copper chaperone CopZ